MPLQSVLRFVAFSKCQSSLIQSGRVLNILYTFNDAYIHVYTITIFAYLSPYATISDFYSIGTIRVYCFTRGSSDGGAGYAHLASISLPLRSNTRKLPDDHVSGLNPSNSV